MDALHAQSTPALTLQPDDNNDESSDYKMIINSSQILNTCHMPGVVLNPCFPALLHVILIPATQESALNVPILPIRCQQWGDSPPFFIDGVTEA